MKYEIEQGEMVVVAEEEKMSLKKNDENKGRKMNKTMEAALRLKGSLIVNDPALFL